MRRKHFVLSLVVLFALGAWAWQARRASWTPRNTPPRPGSIVAFGDSLTAGQGAPPDQSYPSHLARLIGRPVFNAGLPGATSQAAAERLDEVRAVQPAIVILLIGGNDYLQRRDMDEAFVTIERMIAALQDDGVLVVLVGVEGVGPFARFGGRFRDLARRTRALYVPDVLDDILGRSDRMSDRIHPNAEGYRLMAERVASVLSPHLPPPETAP